MTMALREARRDERSHLEQLLRQYLFEFDGRTGKYPGLDAYSPRKPCVARV
jgi:hypothetical protein